MCTNTVVKVEDMTIINSWLKALEDEEILVKDEVLCTTLAAERGNSESHLAPSDSNLKVSNIQQAVENLKWAQKIKDFRKW